MCGGSQARVRMAGGRRGELVWYLYRSDQEDMMLVCFSVSIVQCVACLRDIVSWDMIWYNGG